MSFGINLMTFVEKNNLHLQGRCEISDGNNIKKFMLQDVGLCLLNSPPLGIPHYKMLET